MKKAEKTACAYVKEFDRHEYPFSLGRVNEYHHQKKLHAREGS